MGEGGRGRLQAVLRADMVGSTEMLARLGVDATIDARQHSMRAVELTCGAGTVLDTQGDGVLVGFDSAQSAIAAALELQHAMAEGVDFELRVAVTIDEFSSADGVVPGDVGRRTGEVESACPPGSVVVDDRTRRICGGLVDVRFEALDDGREGDGIWQVSAESLVASEETALRVVLFSDVSASASDGVAALAQSISAEAIDAAGGTIVDTNGAGHVALFDHCTGALAAADEMHEQACAVLLRCDSGEHFELCAGVAMGEVVIVDDAGFGTPMVEAARLLTLASPGTTVLTSAVASLAGATDVIDMGLQSLKGLQEPTAVMCTARRSGPRALLDLPQPLHHHPTFPLIGRSADLDALSSMWRASMLGTARAAVLSGQEGVGKTRLVRELAAVAHGQGATVLFGSCDEDAGAPYAPLVEALNQAVSLDRDLAGAVDAGAGALGVLLGPTSESQDQTVGDSPDRFELFDAVTAAFARLAGERPVLLIVEDIQNGGLDTVRMIEHLITRSVDKRLMVVANCRSEHLGRDSTAHVLLQATWAGNRVEHRRLERLSTADIVAMLESHKGERLSAHQATLATKLAEMTGGNPLYIEELVVYLATAGFLVHSEERGWSLTVDVEELSIPDSLVDLVAHRAVRLGHEALDVLATAALIGSSFDVDILAEVADRDVPSLLDIVDAAASAEMIRFNEADGSCAFADEISRAALLREVRPSRRGVEHRRIAEVLERLRPQAIDQLAVHWSRSIGADARANAARYLRLAGERDMAAAAWDSSAERHRRVLELLALDDFDDVEVLAEVNYRLGASLRNIGDQGFRPALMSAAEMARRSGDADLLARSAIAMMRPGAWYPEAAVVDDDIVAMCEDALLLLGADDPLRPRVLAALGTNLTYGNDRDHRWEIVTEAQRLAKASGDVRLYGTTLASELISFHEPDRFVRRRELADEVRRIGRATGDRHLLFTGSWFLVLEGVQSGDLDSAARLVEELTPIVDAAGEYWPSFLVSHFSTALSIARCDPKAMEAIEDERSRFEHQPVDWFGVSVIQQGAVAMGDGTLADMLLPLAQAAGEYSEGSWGEKWNYAISRAHLDAGDAEGALAAIAVNPDPDFDNYWMASVYHLGLVGLMLRRDDICRDVIEKLGVFRGRFAIIGLGACVGGQVSTALGQAHLGLGDLNVAEELFRESIERADRVGFVYFATNARRFLAQTLLQANPESVEARTLIDAVLVAADQFGFGLERREAELLKNGLDGSVAS